MLKNNLFLIFVLFANCTTAQQKKECSQLFSIKEYKNIIEDGICIPTGNIISRVFKVDINSDNSKDIIVKWYNKDIKNGDSIYYSMYTRNDNEVSFYKTFNNLSPIHINYSDQSESVTLEDSLLNEVKYIYGNAINTQPRFEKGLITMEFEVAATEYFKLYFTYSDTRNTFILTKQELYYSSDTRGQDKKLEETNVFTEDKGLEVEKFDYLDFIYQ